MKKIMIVALCLQWLVAGVAMAQTELQKWQENTKTKPEYVAALHYVGQYQGLTCWVNDAKRHCKQVVLMDHNLRAMRQATLKLDSEGELLATAIEGNHASLIVKVRYSRKLTKIYGVSVELDSMRVSTEGGGFVLLDSLGYSRKDVCHTWGATSPDGHLAGLVHIVEYTKTKQYAACARVYDAELREVWTKDYALTSMDQMCLTDDGTMVTLGYESGLEETRFDINVLTSTTADSYAATVKCDPLIDMRLAGVSGRTLMAMGIWRPANTRERKMLCGGVAGLAFNIDNGTMGGYMIRPFSNEDVNILLNKKTKKNQRHLDVDLVSVCDVTTTTYGAAICIGRNYRLTKTENNGTTTDRYYRTGLHLVGMGTDGEVKWARNIRRNDMQKKHSDDLAIALTTNGDKVVLLKNEHSRFPSNYDIADDAKELETGSTSNMVFYTIAPDGETNKTLVELKTKQWLLRTHRGDEGNLLYYTHRGSRTRAARLKIAD